MLVPKAHNKASEGKWLCFISEVSVFFIFSSFKDIGV